MQVHAILVSEKSVQSLNFIDKLGQNGPGYWFYSGPGEVFAGHSPKGKELFVWPRNGSILNSARSFLRKTNQFVSAIFCERGYFIETVDVEMRAVRRIIMPKETSVKLSIGILELENGNFLLADSSGQMRVFQSSMSEVMHDLEKWSRLTGKLDTDILKILYDGNHPDAVDKETNSSLEMHGAGSGMGTAEAQGEGQGGGGDGDAGSGGASGGGGSGAPSSGVSVEARESGTLDESFQLRSPGEISKEISEAQRQLHALIFQNRLQKLQMTEKEMQTFAGYRKGVQREIKELRAVLESVESKNKERVWLLNKASGDIDDQRLY